MTEEVLTEQMRKQDFDLLKNGLERAGIKKETIEKLNILEELAPNAGRFLVSSLGLSHKMMIYNNIQLMEQAEYIKTHYLEDETLEMEYRIEWQKCYNEIVDIIGKGYDRTLAGTQAMAKIMASQNEGSEKTGKRKLAFSPLTAPKPTNAPKN